VFTATYFVHNSLSCSQQHTVSRAAYRAHSRYRVHRILLCSQLPSSRWCSESSESITHNRVNYWSAISILSSHLRLTIQSDPFISSYLSATRNSNIFQVCSFSGHIAHTVFTGLLTNNGKKNTNLQNCVGHSEIQTFCWTMYHRNYKTFRNIL